MAVLMVLLGSWLALRAAGALGVGPLATWRHSAVYALALMFVCASSAHFGKMKHDLARMIPSGFPQPLLLVSITGVLEFAGALGLLLSPLRRLAGVGLALLLAGLFIANVNAALRGVTLGGKPVTQLWLRTPMQVFFIWLLWWSTQP